MGKSVTLRATHGLLSRLLMDISYIISISAPLHICVTTFSPTSSLSLLNTYINLPYSEKSPHSLFSEYRYSHQFVAYILLFLHSLFSEYSSCLFCLLSELAVSTARYTFF